MFSRVVKWGFVAFVVYLLYRMMPFFVYSGLYVYVDSGVDRAVQPLGEYSNIAMGSYSLRIPKGYLYYKEEIKGGERHDVHMYALLPDISPRTDQNKDQVDFRFFFPRGDNVIRFNLNYFGDHKVKSGKELLQLRRELYALDPNHPGEAGDFGLKVYPAKQREIFPDVFSYKYEDGTFLVLKCGRYGREGKPPFRAECEQDNAYISEGLYLSYEFSRAHLESWREIDFAIKRFVNSIIMEKHHE